MSQWTLKTLEEVVRRMGPVKASTLRFYVSRNYEDLRGFTQLGNKWSNFQGDGSCPRY